MEVNYPSEDNENYDECTFIDGYVYNQHGNVVFHGGISWDNGRQEAVLEFNEINKELHSY